MKGSRSTNNKQSKQGMSHKPRPEIRDDMDHHHTKVDNNHNETVSKKSLRKTKDRG
jgi:hypothetical protein